jgi:RimJ/RimL family protein N-acetyltransferase
MASDPPSAYIDAPEGLTDGVITIRRLSAATDARPFAAAFAEDPHLGTAIGVENDPTEAQVAGQADEEPASGRVPPLGIADAATGEFLGAIGIYRLERQHEHGEIGFWLTPGARGRGIATRAVRLLTTWGFEHLDLHRMEITTTPDNEGTLRLAEALGFTREGVMRERNLERGRRVDVVMLAVLRRDWRR